mgnify:CR=1 FL=1
MPLQSQLPSKEPSSMPLKSPSKSPTAIPSQSQSPSKEPRMALFCHPSLSYCMSPSSFLYFLHSIGPAAPLIPWPPLGCESIRWIQKYAFL